MAGMSFAEKLVNVELLGQKDVEDFHEAALEYRKLYNSQAYDETVVQIHENQGDTARKRATLCLELCNKWSCRIGGSVRGEALKAIPKAEGLVGKIEKSLEQIERPDH